MAWHTIQATGDLTVELWLAGEADNQPLLKIRSKATEGEITIYLDEVRHLVDALVNAAVDLVAVEAERLTRNSDDDDNGNLSPGTARIALGENQEPGGCSR